MPDLQALREDYRLKKAALLQSVQGGGASTRGIHSVLQKLARQAATTLLALWHLAEFSDRFALVAVGGFGR
ncbi:MAG: hypothetical protein EPN40_02845, partial [Rhodanobacteraceae bacterium]